jgi:hypothetical protein
VIAGVAVVLAIAAIFGPILIAWCHRQTARERHALAEYERVMAARRGRPCKRCGEPVAYQGAIYCGAGCSARSEDRS